MNRAKNWQSPVQEIVIPLMKDNPNIKAWACWIWPGAVEIRVVKYLLTIDHENSTQDEIVYTERRTEALLSTGKWIDIPEMEVVPACKILTEEQATKVGVKPIEDGVHVYQGDRDCCMKCGYNGMQLIDDREAGFEFPCPGWLGSPIG